MAKRAIKKTWAGKKPAVKLTSLKANKAAKAAKVPKEPKIPDTKEDLIQQIGAVLVEVNAAVKESRGKSPVRFNHWDGIVGKYKLSINKLMDRLFVVPGCENTLTVFTDTFGAPRGTEPLWTQPGMFLVWIGHIPVRCVWAGFAEEYADMVAADPNKPFPAPSGTISTGTTIGSDDTSVGNLFRNRLTILTLARGTDWRRAKGHVDLGPSFKLLPLTPEAKEAARLELERPENAWLVAALARGPVNPIPLPEHLLFVQNSLFA